MVDIMIKNVCEKKLCEPRSLVLDSCAAILYCIVCFLTTVQKM